MDLAIQTIGLTRRFGNLCAVDALTIEVERGTFYGFLGPNGAGKSTTIKMLTGLLAPTSGVMRLLGLDLALQEPASSQTAYWGRARNLSLFENLARASTLLSLGECTFFQQTPSETARPNSSAMMNLQTEEKKLAMEYSHGMRKKLALAAALLPNPDLLFLDEPFEGVNAVASRVLRDTLKRTVERGATVFLTSHVLEIVERLCTHVGIIAKGKLVHQGWMEDLRREGSLEERFLEVVGAGELERQKLSWLEADK